MCHYLSAIYCSKPPWRRGIYQQTGDGKKQLVNIFSVFQIKCGRKLRWVTELAKYGYLFIFEAAVVQLNHHSYLWAFTDSKCLSEEVFGVWLVFIQILFFTHEQRLWLLFAIQHLHLFKLLRFSDWGAKADSGWYRWSEMMVQTQSLSLITCLL